MATTTWQSRRLLAATLVVGLTTNVAAKSGDVYFENLDAGPGGSKGLRPLANARGGFERSGIFS